LSKILYIAEQVDCLVKKAGTRNPLDICAYKKCTVHYMNLQQRLKAYYFYHSRINNIVIDENVSEEFQSILIAHELGHMTLHKEQIALMKCMHELEILDKSSDSTEYEANLFAAELLLEDKPVLELLNEYTFFETAHFLNVPAALLDFKFSILQAKGYGISPMQYAQADFLKDNDIGAYMEKSEI
jgi:Zn-dependent peptidase ImmA (M78 family)